MLGVALRAVGVCPAQLRGKRGIVAWRSSAAPRGCARRRGCASGLLWPASGCCLSALVSVAPAPLRIPAPAPFHHRLTCASVGRNWMGIYLVASPCRHRCSCLHNTNLRPRPALRGHSIRLRLRGPVVHAHRRHSPATPTGNGHKPRLESGHNATAQHAALCLETSQESRTGKRSENPGPATARCSLNPTNKW